MSATRSRRAWDTYIRRFHQERPGITDAILSRSRDGAKTPYEWLAEGLAASGVVLDVACGNGPLQRVIVDGWIGVDASATELAAAEPDAGGRATVGDIRELPVRPGSCDTVICSMALMLIDPLAPAIDEIARVLRPTGIVRILLPAREPLTTQDRLRYLRLGIALRTRALFPPSPLHRHAEEQLTGAGLAIVDDQTRHFTYPLRSRDDAHRLVESLYLPDVSQQRARTAARVAEHWIGSDLGLPLRRVTAAVRASYE